MKSLEKIKELRKITGLGMLDCKNALDESNYDIEAAIKILKSKGIAKAIKKQSLLANEGLVYANFNNNYGVIFVLNCQTDFVARTNDFQKLMTQISNVALGKKCETISSLKNQKILNSNSTINDEILSLSAKLGEKIEISNYKLLEKQTNDIFGIYNHSNGLISTLVILKNSQNNKLAKDIAMHVCAMNPQFISKNNINKDEYDNIKNEILKNNENNLKNKPAKIVEKIVEGKMQKKLANFVLENQNFVKDNSLTIKKILDINKTCVLKMVRYNIN